MPVFSYSILIGVEEVEQKYVNAELMICIVKSKTAKSYAEHLSNEVNYGNKGEKEVLVTDNKNYHNENLKETTFEGVCLKSYSRDFGEVHDFDPEIDFDVPQEIFSKSFRFKNSQKYYEFMSAPNMNDFHNLGMYSNPDRYFFWTAN